jgi:hypothetical protein
MMDNHSRNDTSVVEDTKRLSANFHVDTREDESQPPSNNSFIREIPNEIKVAITENVSR